MHNTPQRGMSVQIFTTPPRIRKCAYIKCQASSFNTTHERKKSAANKCMHNLYHRAQNRQERCRMTCRRQDWVRERRALFYMFCVAKLLYILYKCSLKEHRILSSVSLALYSTQSSYQLRVNKALAVVVRRLEYKINYEHDDGTFSFTPRALS